MNDIPARKLTTRVERKITDDWARMFPGLGIYRPRWLMRRVGPMLIGICLDRDSGGEKYKPCFHTFFLGTPWPAPVPALMLCTQLRAVSGGPGYVSVRWHDSKYEDAARRLSTQAPLPLDGPLTLNQVVDAYYNHTQTPLGQRQVPVLLKDCILLFSLCDFKADALLLLDQLLSAPDEEPKFRVLGGREKFEQDMRSSINNPDVVRRTIVEQTIRLKVTDLPTGEFSY